MEWPKHTKTILVYIAVLSGVYVVAQPLEVTVIYKVIIASIVAAIVLVIMLKDEIIPKVDRYKLREKSIESFFAEINLQDVNRIDILTHTGNKTFETLRKLITTGDEIDKNKYKSIQIRVLVHDPSCEIPRRKRYITNTVNAIRALKREHYNIQVHYYHVLPTFRSIVVTTKRNGKEDKKAFVSWYWFVDEKVLEGVKIANSEKLGRAFIFSSSRSKTNTKNVMVNLVESWFNRFWGKSEDGDIHTIIFDFDDTLVITHDYQIEAWVTTVCKADKIIGDSANEKVKNDISNLIDDRGKLKEKIGKIFFTKESAQLIIKELFDGLSEGEEKKINDYRFAERKKLMKKSQFSTYAKNAIKKLAKNYHLAIVSATSSRFISDWLNDREMDEYFSVILGKNEEVVDWKDVRRKSLLTLQICNMLGVPPSRMVYIGDRDGDYKAALGIGVDFVEARLFSAELISYIGKGSLLPIGHQDIYFNDWSNIGNSINTVINRKHR